MNKKIFKLFIILLLIASILTTLTGCQINTENSTQNPDSSNENTNESVPSFAELIKKYTENEKKLHGDVIEAYYNPKDYKLLQSEDEGIISITFADFNDDNEEECIIARLTSNNNITLTLYKNENNEIKELTCFHAIGNITTCGDMLDLDIFAKKINNKTKLFAELYYTSSLLSNGTSWILATFELVDNEFKKLSDDSESGSAFMPDELEEYKTKIKNTGLNVTDFSISNNSKRLMFQNTDLIKLCTMSKKHISNFNSSKYMTSKETKVQYGEITFTDYSKTSDEIVTENTTESSTNQTNSESNTINIENYLGQYKCKKGNDTIQFSLEKQNGKIVYYFMYYPNSSAHASEELWGSWDSSKKSISSITNENTNAIASYDFTNIEYKNGSIEITTKLNKVHLPQFKSSAIPDGTYVFKK